MLFSSITFLFAFLPLVLLLYFLTPARIGKLGNVQLRNYILLVVSLLFYGWGEPVYILLMIASIVVSYWCAIRIEAYLACGKKKKAVVILVISIICNLSALCVFKYADFLLVNLNQLFGWQIPLLELPLPIGISFYSFQIMSYVIDVYRKEVAAQRNICYLGTYVALFPQLIAGPIVRYQDVAKQLMERHEDSEQFAQGVRRFIVGLGKKVVFANNIGMLFDSITKDTVHLSVASAWLAVVAFMFQIYFDFSGYSDMAIGLGKMFGFHFLENFRYPYLAQSITEFWRRWHISLSSWFRDYIYIPLGGNRCGKIKQYRNIVIVWFLTGMWHGASWNFILWGLYFCVLLILEKTLLLRIWPKVPRFLRHLYACFFILVGWAIFAFDQTKEMLGWLGSMFTGNLNGKAIPLWNESTTSYLGDYWALLILVGIAATPIGKIVMNKMENRYPKLTHIVLVPVAVLLVLVLVSAFLASDSFNPFLYFRF